MRAEILCSESLAQVSLEADLLFRSMILVADDFGRLDGRIPMLKVACFPLRDSVTLKKIGRWLGELIDLPDPPIVPYEVNGRPYLQLTGWEKHRGKSKRAQGSKFPDPPEVREDEHRASPEIRENPADPPDGMESRVRGKESREISGETPDPSQAADPWSWENPKAIDKPDRFQGEAKARIVAWAESRGHSRRILNDALELWEEWTEPVSGKNRRTIRSWVGSFERMVRASLDEGKIVRETDEEKYQRELAASPLYAAREDRPDAS